MSRFDAEELRKLAADHLRKKLPEVVDGARLVEELGADALDVIELVMLLEDRYRIDIFDRELDALVTFGDWRALIERKVEKQAA